MWYQKQELGKITEYLSKNGKIRSICGFTKLFLHYLIIAPKITIWEIWNFHQILIFMYYK